MDGIDYRTTDVARWGAGSGAGTGGNLTPLQVDMNFWTLYLRVQNLIDHPPTAVGIMGFTIVGSQLQVNMTDGSTLGPYTLPVATFRMMGDWVNDMPLLPLDIVTVPHDGVYFVNIAYTTPSAPATFDPTVTDGSGNLIFTKVFGDDAYIYDFGFYYPGLPGASVAAGGVLAGHIVARQIVLPVGLAGSYANLGTPPAADVSYPIEVNGTPVGSVDFAAGENAGTFTFTSEYNMSAGDVVTLKRPTAVDATAADLSITFVATRLFL